MCDIYYIRIYIAWVAYAMSDYAFRGVPRVFLGVFLLTGESAFCLLSLVLLALFLDRKSALD